MLTDDKIRASKLSPELKEQFLKTPVEQRAALKASLLGQPESPDIGGPTIEAYMQPQETTASKEASSLYPTVERVASMAYDPRLLLPVAATAALGPEAGIGARMAMGGLSQAGGEGFRQIGQQMSGSPNAPQTGGEAARRIGMEGIAGTAGELLGMRPGFKPSASNQLIRIDNDMRAGIKSPETGETVKAFLTPALWKDNKRAIGFVEGIAEGGIGSGKLISAKQNIKDYARARALSLAKQLNPGDEEVILKDVLENSQKSFQSQARGLYQELDDLLAKQGNVWIDTTPIQESAQALLNQSSASGGFFLRNEGILASLKNIAGTGKEPIGKKVNFSTAHDIRSGILEALRDAQVGSQAHRVLTKMNQQLTDIMGTKLDKVDVLARNKWEEAREFYSKGKDQYYGTLMTALMKKEPEKIAGMMLRPNNVSRITKVLNAIPDPDERRIFSNMVIEQHVRDLIAQSETIEGSIRGQKLFSAMKRMEPELNALGLNETRKRQILDTVENLRIANQSQNMGSVTSKVVMSNAITGLAAGNLALGGRLSTTGLILSTPWLYSQIATQPTLAGMFKNALKVSPNKAQAIMMKIGIMAVRKAIDEDRPIDMIDIKMNAENQPGVM